MIPYSCSGTCFTTWPTTPLSSPGWTSAPAASRSTTLWSLPPPGAGWSQTGESHSHIHTLHCTTASSYFLWFLHFYSNFQSFCSGLRRWIMRRCPGPWGTTTAVRGRAGRDTSPWSRRSVSITSEWWLQNCLFSFHFELSEHKLCSSSAKWNNCFCAKAIILKKLSHGSQTTKSAVTTFSV